MLKADRDFNQAMADHDLKRFLSFVAADATFDSAEGRGKDAVAKAWAPFFAPNGPTISGRRRRPRRSSLAMSATRSARGSATRRTPAGNARRPARPVSDGVAEADGRQPGGDLRHGIDGALTALDSGLGPRDSAELRVLRARFFELRGDVFARLSGETTRANGPKLRIQLSKRAVEADVERHRRRRRSPSRAAAATDATCARVT